MSDLHITGTAGYSMGAVARWTVLGTDPTTEVAYVKSPALAKDFVRLRQQRDELREFARDLERHCLNHAGLKGLRHAEEGQELRARLQCILASTGKDQT